MLIIINMIIVFLLSVKIIAIVIENVIGIFAPFTTTTTTIIIITAQTC